MSGKEKAVKVKADIEKKKAALISLQSMNGKTIPQMSKAEQEALLTALGQMLSVVDNTGKVFVQ